MLCLGVGLLAAPTIALSGCGGGSTLTTPVPTQLNLSATFSNRTVDVPTTLQTTTGTCTYSDNDAPATNTLSLNYDGDGNQSLSVSFSKIGKIKSGDVIPLSNAFPIEEPGIGVLFYTNLSKNQSYVAKSGTIKIDSISSVSGNAAAVRIRFTLSNAALVSESDRSSTAPVVFKVNGSGQAITYPL